LNNTRADKTKFVFALYGHNAIDYGRTKVNKMLDEIIEYMKLPHWQTVKGNRPLVPVLWPLQFESMLAAQSSSSERMTLSEFVELIRARVVEAGLKNPYIVAEEISKTYLSKGKLATAGFDAISDYAGAYGGSVSPRDQGPTYASATETMISEWNLFLSPNIECVPPLVTGWYPWPRAESESWWHYQNPLPGELTTRVQKTFDFISDNIENCKAQVIFAYSWNEHSEGGTLNPTMGESPDYEPVTTYLDEVTEALK